MNEEQKFNEKKIEDYLINKALCFTARNLLRFSKTEIWKALYTKHAVRVSVHQGLHRKYEGVKLNSLLNKPSVYIYTEADSVANW